MTVVTVGMSRPREARSVARRWVHVEVRKEVRAEIRWRGVGGSVGGVEGW